MPDIGPPIDVRRHFEPERRALLAVLQWLDPEDWWLPTVCGDWSVHDVAIHLLGADINILSGDRDGFRGSPLAPAPGNLDNAAELVAFIDDRNARWVDGLARVSPRLLIELLEWTGASLDRYWPTVDMDAPGIPVSWAGTSPSPAWLHVARELTERWTHHHHIRDAVGLPMLADVEMTAAVLDTFVRALPFTLRDITAAQGASARLSISGPGGGSWTVVRGLDGWSFDANFSGEVTCLVQCTVDTAWRAFTLGMSPGERREAMRFEGDPAIADRIVDMVTIVG